MKLQDELGRDLLEESYRSLRDDPGTPTKLTLESELRRKLKADEAKVSRVISDLETLLFCEFNYH